MCHLPSPSAHLPELNPHVLHIGSYSPISTFRVCPDGQSRVFQDYPMQVSGIVLGRQRLAGRVRSVPHDYVL